MLTITNNYELAIEDATGILAFTASWCVPCRALKPQLVKLSAQTDRNIYVLDVDELPPALLEFYQIKSVPTVVAYSGEDSWVYINGRTIAAILSELGE
jgi:thiol-disulfide isomerase/thioredoxin